MRLYDIVIICHNNEMNATHTRSSRVYHQLSRGVAKQVVAIAEEESRNLSELFREAFRTYRVERIERKLMAKRRIAAEGSSGNGWKTKLKLPPYKLATSNFRGRAQRARCRDV